MRRTFALALVCSLALASPSWANPSTEGSTTTAAKRPTKKKTSKKKRRTSKAKKATPKASKPKKSDPIDVMLNVGFGPAVHMVTGPIQDDQRYHFGIKLYLKAIIDAATIKENLFRVPKKYRGMAKGMKELRIGHLLIPDTLFISPRVENTAMYGINWRPLALEVPLTRSPVRLAVGLGINISYAYINTEIDTPETATTAATQTDTTTHFFRPGADLTASLEIPFSDTFLIDFGWASTFYPPQEVGGDIFALGELDESIWHIGQAFLRLHFRTPYSFKL